jgi:hypothetical protein
VGRYLPPFGFTGRVLSKPAWPKLLFAANDLCDPELSRRHNRFNPIIACAVDNLPTRR